MKKALIPALLVVSAAFTPCLRNALELPDRVCQVAQEVAAPLFWHLWDKLLTRELARAAQGVGRSDASSWPPVLRQDAVICIVFHIILKHAFNGPLSVGKENNSFSVSISSALIRCTIERGLLFPSSTSDS